MTSGCDREYDTSQHLVAIRGGNRPADVAFRTHTPFELDGVTFGSVEAFYSWLFCGPVKRLKVAPLWGPRAKHECPKNPPATYDYHDGTIVRSSPDHYELILRANRAKLDAHPEIARAFVATHPRPIVHELPDKSDPHDVFCWIMNTLRDEYVIKLGAGDAAQAESP